MASKLETLAVKLWVGPWGVAESEALKADWHPAGCAAANKTVWPSSVASRCRPQIEISDGNLKIRPPSVLIAKKKNQWGAGYDMRTEQRKIASKGTAGERVPIVRPRHAFLFFLPPSSAGLVGPLCQVADYSIRTHFLRFKVWGSLAPL